MLTSNLEPRRAWGMGQKYFSRWLELEDDEVRCLSCGAVSVRHGAGTTFCSECREWSKQSNIDDDWDDLGESG